MKDFDLQFFMDKVNEKPIQIEFMNTDEDLVALINLVITNAEIKEESYWNILTINDDIMIYFDDFEVGELETTKNALCLYKGGEVLINIYLPEGYDWESNTGVIGFARY